jgi:predicted enzyme involved in methoxymalonyl-ACP biosynthesis
VGTAIVDVEGDTWTIDTFLMSCRVLGRGVESAFLAAVADDAAAAGAVRLVGRYEPTRKNAQVATFYTAHGFTEVAGAPGTFRCDLGDTRPERPAHIETTR